MVTVLNMPLDKARIQGFGSDGPAEEKPPECPQGHELQLWAARSGKCDGCNAKVTQGEQVMDCRRCNWYLCDACAPQDKADDKSTIWGALTSLPFYVLDDMSEMATDIESFVTASVFDQETQPGSSKAAAEEETKVSPLEKAESEQIVTEFCENYPAARVSPNAMDLDVFWNKVGKLQPKALADAIYDQLSFSGGEYEWQPRLRALFVLEHLHNKGGMGREVTKIVLHSAKALLQHLTEVSQCTTKATQVIKLLKNQGDEDTTAASSSTDPLTNKDSGAAADDEGEAPSSASSSKPAAKAAQVGLPKAKAVTSAAKAAPAVDLLDMAMPEVVTPVAKGGGLDLLDTPAVAAPVGGPDLLLDLTTVAAPGTTAAPAFSMPVVAAGPAAIPQSATPNLADLFALYPQGQTASSGPSSSPMPAAVGTAGSPARGYPAGAMGALSTGGVGGLAPPMSSMGAMGAGGSVGGMRANGMGSGMGLGPAGTMSAQPAAMGAMGSQFSATMGGPMDTGAPPAFAASSASAALSLEKASSPEKAPAEKNAQQSLESLLSDCVGNLEVNPSGSKAGFSTSMSAGRQIIRT